MHYFSRLILLSALLLSVACAPQRTVTQGPYAEKNPVARVAIQQPANKELADDVLFRAFGLVGTPYKYGGNTPESGFDCSGLIKFVYSDTVGLQLPRTTGAMMQTKAPVVPRNQLRSGDIVFFATSGGRRVSHAGIYVGEGRFVHAPSTGGTVRLDSLDSQYWKKAYLQAKRFLPEQQLVSNP
ncbi:MAG: C40 family peptidase [Gammaproteobacteria bacterium]|nr:C40 family peptidase [Gammaproteobacteria bacterium]